MLIVANGAYKSGSTWMYFVLKQLRSFEAPPARFLASWRHPSLDLRKAVEFLDSGLHRQGNYLVKQHVSGKSLRAMVAHSDEQVLYFDIVRDYRDVVVSAFHHARRD